MLSKLLPLRGRENHHRSDILPNQVIKSIAGKPLATVINIQDLLIALADNDFGCRAGIKYFLETF